MTIETTTGGVVTRGKGSMDIAVFYRRNAKAVEQPLHIAEKDKTSEIKNLNTLSIVQSGATRTGKFWATKRNNYPDGSYLKLNIMQRGTSIHSFGVTNIMIRARDAAPLQRISIDLPVDERSNMAVAHIEGRFDILPKEEIVALGLGKNAQGGSDLANYFDPGEGEDFIRIAILEAELAPKAQIKAKVINTSKDRGGKVLLKQRRVRHIRT